MKCADQDFMWRDEWAAGRLELHVYLLVDNPRRYTALRQSAATFPQPPEEEWSVPVATAAVLGVLALVRKPERRIDEEEKPES